MSALETVYRIYNPLKLSDLSDFDKAIASSELVLAAAEWYMDDSFTNTGACPTKKESFDMIYEAAKAIVTETDPEKFNEKFNFADFLWSDLMKAKENFNKKCDAMTAKNYGFDFEDDDYDEEDDIEDEEF